MSRRLRVLTLVEGFRAYGGAEKLACEITLRLDPERFERRICATKQEQRPDFLEEFAEAGIPVLMLDRGGTFDLPAWRPLVSLLRRERIDVVHAHMFGSNAWSVLWGRLARVPVIVAHEHTWSFEGRRLRKLVDREVIARGADVFVAVSREDERRMHELERISPADTLFLPNGIAPLAPPSGKDVRAELGIPPDPPVVGTIGILRPQKALDVLVRAAAAVVRDFPNAHVLIAGGGPEKEPLRELIAGLGLESSVHLIGLRRDVPDVLAAIDVAVSSSDFEGSPLAVMEYMAAGKPVVATRVGGVPDLIDDGVHGLLVERQDPEALGAAIAAVLRDPERAAEMGRRGRERQRAEFDLDVMVERIGRLYEELFERSRRGRQEAWTAERKSSAIRAS